MKKRKKVMSSIILILTVVIINILCIKVYAAGQGDLFPNSDALGISSSQPKMFDKYPIWNYMFDSEKIGILDAWAYPIKALVNALFLLTVCISYIVNFLLMSCFKLSIFSLISNELDRVVWAARDSIFIPLLSITTPIIGITIIFNVALGKFQSAWRVIFNTLIVMLISFSFLAKPSLVIKMVNDMSDDVSSSVLAGTVNVVSSSYVSADDAVVNLGNVFWESTVIKPWQVIEFGDTTIGEQEMDGILQYSPSAEQRKDKAQSFAKDYELFTPEGQVSRLVMVLFIGIVTLAIDIFVLIMAGLTIMMQFGAIISAVIMVIAFTISMLPNMGPKVAIQSLYNTFGFLLGKIGMTVLLALYFSINSVIYRSSAQYGWFLATILQALLIVAIVVYRKKLLGFAYSITGGQQQAIRNVHSKGESLKSIGKSLGNLYVGKKVYEDMKHMNEQRKDKKLDKKYRPEAEQFLKQRYTNEKRAAEAKAAEFNNAPENIAAGKRMEPQYSDFVRTVDARVDKGFTPFDEKMIRSTVESFKALHREGNDPRNLLTTEIDGRSGDEIRESQRELEKSVDYEMEKLENRRKTNSYNINRSIKSDKESQLYTSSVAAVTKTADVIKKAADVAGVSKIVESMVISSSSNGAMDEIRQDRLEREYQEMKRAESIQQSESELVEERQVVNGYTSRPGGREPIRNMRSEIKIVDTNKYADIGGDRDSKVSDNVANDDIMIQTSEELSNEKVKQVTDRNGRSIRNDNRISEKVTELNSRAVDNVVNEKLESSNNNNNIRDKVIENKDSVNNVINRNESITSNNSTAENVSEINKKVTDNMANENRTVTNSTENATNRTVENRETVNNVINRNEAVSNINRIVDNVSEINNKVVENVANENRTVTDSTENATNRTIENRETVNNVTNRNESVSNINRIVDNVSEINNKVAENVANENRTVTNSTENATNRTVENRETVNNVTNRSESVSNINRIVDNVSEINNKVVENVANENRTVTDSTENATNRTIENRETVNNVTNRNESVSNINRIVDNVSEINNKVMDNVVNHNSMVMNNNENIINKAIENKEIFNNHLNTSENIVNKNSRVENINVSNIKKVNQTTEVANNIHNLTDMTSNNDISNIIENDNAIKIRRIEERLERLRNLKDRHK